MKFLQVRLKTSEIALMSLIILGALGLFNFLWKKSPPVATLNEIRAKTEVTKKQLADNRTLYDRLAKRGPSAEGLNSDFMDQYVLLNDHFSSVITGIIGSSKTKGFTVTKLSLEDQTTESGYKKMLYSLDAESSFIDVGKFLEKLEDAPLLTEVTSVEINRIDNEMKRCKAKIKLYSYVRIE